MSDVVLNIVDSQRAIHSEVRGETADAIVAALSAEPETIEELQTALGRYIKPKPGRGFFDGWPSGTRDEANDSADFVIDLAARLVAGRSEQWLLEPQGRVAYRDENGATKVGISYDLSDDWLFSEDMDGWRALAEQRRRQRSATPPLDARKVLYGNVIEFIVSECLSAARSGGKENPIAAIHARWLMAPRDDLRGASPREVLMAKRESIDWDLEGRAGQWSRLGECPPGLDSESAAFRFGGFGTHENVVYYDLIRHLLESCWDRVGKRPEVHKGEEIERLRRLEARWLRTPQREELDGYSPGEVIDRERLRLPLVVQNKHGMADDDCPLCQMMAEQSGPAFWHLDGCNRDDDFAFSFHDTREEWEAEHREWEEYDRRSKEERARERDRQSFRDALAPSARVDLGETAPLWTRCYSNPDALEQLSEGQAREVLLFGVGGCLAELGLELKGSPDTKPLVETLNRDFGNLREVTRKVIGGLVEPVVQTFCDNLRLVAEARPDLSLRCADLESQLESLAKRLLDE